MTDKRTEPVDLSQFEGMSDEVNIYEIPTREGSDVKTLTLSISGTKQEAGYSIELGCSTFETHQKWCKRFAALPALIADLEATREERDTCKAFIEQLVDDMTCKTSPKFGGVELTMCTPVNTVELFNKARTLLTELEDTP